nr:hypothetical protein [Clostridia bacterium]
MDIVLKDRGIRPDPVLVQTSAIQAIIDECEQTGGGSVVFEAGIYRTGTLYLRSNVYLNLPPMATIMGSDDYDDYNDPHAWEHNPVSVNEKTNGKHLIVALWIENSGIYGGGTINGNGSHFGYSYNDPDFRRMSNMVYLSESKNLRLDGITLTNPAYWDCFVVGCEDVIITRLKIKTGQSIPNCDGIDLDCSKRVVISDCIIDTEDDCITFRGNEKALSKEAQKRGNVALEDITVANCQIRTKGCNAFRIGVGSSPIRNCRITNVIVRDSAKGVCMESRYMFNTDENPGCNIENISFNNIYFDCVLPVYISAYCLGHSDVISAPIRNISFSDIYTAAEHNVIVQGNKNGLVEGITFENFRADFKGVPKYIDKYGYGEWDYATS